MDVPGQWVAFLQLVINGPDFFHLVAPSSSRGALQGVPGVNTHSADTWKTIYRIINGRFLWVRTGSDTHHFCLRSSSWNSGVWPHLIEEKAGKLHLVVCPERRGNSFGEQLMSSVALT